MFNCYQITAENVELFIELLFPYLILAVGLGLFIYDTVAFFLSKISAYLKERKDPLKLFDSASDE